ncbi:MAG TPA: hypothetical protein VMW76_08565 [Bacteroidales bacterium]|nr:hypothetical protein [Bacteroidales bacterium]
MKMRLEEGKKYIFQVTKTVRFEEETYFVLKGPDNRRYLIPSARYYGYNIILDGTIHCRVDKINCNGEVYLEPEHPYYREGEKYEFTITERDIRIDRSGRPHGVIVASGVAGAEVVIPDEYIGDREISPGDTISLLIERITKGQIIVAGTRDEKRTIESEEESYTLFQIDDVVKGIDGRSYFLVTSPSGIKHSLPYEYYKHYGLKKGSEFRGRFIRYRKNTNIRIEPENPFFKIGEVYDFTVKEVITIAGRTKHIAIVTDLYGYNHRIKTTHTFASGEPLRLKVEKIRKGWPQLTRV